MLCQSECACATVNMVVFLILKKTHVHTQKGELSCNCTDLSLERREGIHACY